MRVTRRFIVFGAAITGGVLGAAGIGAATGGSGGSEPEVSAWVDGGTELVTEARRDALVGHDPVQVGDVVAVTERLPDGSCAQPTGGLHIRVSAPTGMVASASVETTDDCRYVVSDISVEPADEAAKSDIDPPDEDHAYGGRTVMGTER
jgi:hypothetical protein